MGLIFIISPKGGGNSSANYMSTSHFVDFWSIFKTFWENLNNFKKKIILVPISHLIMLNNSFTNFPVKSVECEFSAIFAMK